MTAAIHRLIGNHRNDLVGAVITSTSVKSSTDIRLLSTTQTGNATVTLTGAYTGAANALIDVEILDTLVDTVPRLSAPAFSGAGNGVMTLGTVTSGATAQTLTVKLTNTGVLTVNAALNFDEVVLQAKATGDAGNGMQIDIDRSGLVFTASDFSLLRDLEAGKELLEGPEYEWDTVAARSDGTIPDTAKRLTFGDDPTIYRQWKSYTDGSWQYHLHPALERAMPKGTRVVFVTGGRTVTISQDATTETYTDIITPYDLLAALQNHSNLIEVVGPVVPDQQPGGMAMREWRARTDAHALPTTGEGSEYATGFTGMTVGEDAATELVQATCWAISNKDYPSAALGKEVWQVKGSVSGILQTHAITGDAVTAGAVRFTIPQKMPDGYTPDDVNQRGRFRLSDVSYVSREEGQEPPPICAKSLVLGVAATDKTLTCVYTKRPGTDCACADMRPEGRLNAECLGLDFIEGETSMATDAGYIARLQTLATWHSTFTRSNTDITTEGELRSAEYDLQLADLARDELFSTLDDIYGGGITTKALWEAAWDSAMTTVDTDLTGLEGVGEALTAAGGIKLLAYGDATLGQVYYISGYRTYSGQVGSHSVKVYLVCTTAGTIQTAETNVVGYHPSLSDAGFAEASPDIGVIWQSALGTAVFRVISAFDATYGVAGESPTTGTTDINAVAVRATDPGFSYTVESWAKRITAACNVVRAIAGLPPKKGKTGTTWTPCWSDQGDDLYWAINGGEYQPAFTNQIYHSCITCCDGSGQTDVFPTHEFAFAIMVQCPELLKEGDKVTLVIGESGWPATYQVGDILTLPVIAAAPLELAGGVTGTDTLTWSVNSSTAGALPSYPVPLAAPVPYTEAAVQFTITPGAIAFAAGDTFTVALEGGHLRYRRDAGSWSSTLPVAATHDLGDGLTLGFAAGVPPSLVTGDSWQWQVTQPFSPVAIVNPVVYEGFEWTGAEVALQADFGAEQTIPAVLVALHTLPLTAGLIVAGSVNGSTWWTQTLTVQAGPMVAFLTGKTARYLELRITGATGARIGWWWAGTPFQPSGNATTVTLSRVYGMARGSGLNPTALYRGQGRGGELAWEANSGDWLEPADMTELLALMDRCKSWGDEPFALCPNVTVPSETALVVPDADDVQFTDILKFQNNATTRYLSASIPLRAVIE